MLLLKAVLASDRDHIIYLLPKVNNFSFQNQFSSNHVWFLPPLLVFLFLSLNYCVQNSTFPTNFHNIFTYTKYFNTWVITKRIHHPPQGLRYSVSLKFFYFHSLLTYLLMPFRSNTNLSSRRRFVLLFLLSRLTNGFPSPGV